MIFNKKGLSCPLYSVFLQAVMEMSQRQKDTQAVEGQPPAGSNNELQFQQGLKKLEEGERLGENGRTRHIVE